MRKNNLRYLKCWVITRRSKLHIACSDFFQKSLLLILSQLLSKSQTLRWFAIWFFGCGIYSVGLSHVGASFISLAPTFLQKSERAHAAAPPFQTEPAALGFGLVLDMWKKIVSQKHQLKQRTRLRRVLCFNWCFIFAQWQIYFLIPLTARSSM